METCADGRAFLSELAAVRRMAPSTQTQAMATLLFLYGTVLRRPLARIQGITRARLVRGVPAVLTPAEVRSVLQRLTDPERLMVSLLYGSAMRINECVALRVKDVDCERREMVIRGGKGDRDRRVPLAAAAPVMCSGIPSRRTCSRAAPTSAPFRSCSAIAASRRR
jgi:integrase